nr:serine carboxypeptidase-like 45 [Ipomoea batatas]
MIHSLPGQPCWDVTFDQYSGYIVTDKFRGRALFYYFVEAQTENKLSMPLTLWLGGGHDCSSAAIGAFYEHGPFRPRKDGRLEKNKFSWNSESNMLYIDTPIGVVFSYSNTSSDYKIWNDTMTARENMKFLRKWFNEFSEYRDTDFYIAGDSYGAKADPCLLDWIDDYITRPDVQKALHANATAFPYSWNSIFQGNRDTNLYNLAIDILPTLSTLLKSDIPVLIYSGDQDLRIPVTHTRILANELASRLELNTLEMNEPWYDGNQIGGWSVTFGKLGEGKKGANLTFATVRGGAHFVPSSSPSQALTLFKAFLKGSSPPKNHSDH